MGLQRQFQAQIKAAQKSGIFWPAAMKRTDCVSALMGRRHCDLLIIGSGLEAATCAHLAALNGLATVLLAETDFGAGSPCQSLLCKSDPRILQYSLRAARRLLFDSRVLLETAPHRTARLRGGVVKVPGERRRIRDTINGFLFDRQVADRANGFNMVLFDLRRLIWDRCLAARQEGAIVLNHATLRSWHQREVGGSVVGWKDLLGDARGDLVAGAVVNCNGLRAPETGRLKPAPFGNRIVAAPWIELCSRIGLPDLTGCFTDGSERVEISPYRQGTLLRWFRGGGAETLEQAELVRALQSRSSRLGIDLRPFVDGIVWSRQGSQSQLKKEYSEKGRPWEWHRSAGSFTLLGDAGIEAQAAAEYCLHELFTLSRVTGREQALTGRILPGGSGVERSVKEFSVLAAAQGIDPGVSSATGRRLGSRVRLFSEEASYLQLLAEVVLRGEFLSALWLEGCGTLSDLVARFEFDLDGGGTASRLETLVDALAAELQLAPEVVVENRESCLEQQLLVREFVDLLKAGFTTESGH